MHPPANETIPSPWTIEALDSGFKIVDANGQSLAYVYGHADPRDAAIAKALTLDEAQTVVVQEVPNTPFARGAGPDFQPITPV